MFISNTVMSNGARFINSSDEQHKENCKPIIGILGKNEIAIILTSIRDIAKGEELFYEYGDKYWR